MARLSELIDKAKATGRLRADFVHQDMIMVFMANSGVLAATTEAAQDTWRRLVAYLIQAFAAEAAGPLPDPATPDEVTLALLRRNAAAGTLRPIERRRGMGLDHELIPRRHSCPGQPCRRPWTRDMVGWPIRRDRSSPVYAMMPAPMLPSSPTRNPAVPDTARLTTQALPATATFTGPLESAIRLIYGRLTRSTPRPASR